ncbi:DUF2971 domain-containing protein [Yersinia enterocolitica]|nr:DUF2971 domain-containing protein [Yersinia enterocolitica]EKN4862629.1 DUF2971 domain-containing protein [Yersinia enterocolitica]HEC2535283.1 DUF2971 domain-containing protein [Yersinia enterocolitica]
MSDVKVGDSMAGVTALWRYMSLDKLINLLDTEKLYFSPLSVYAMSDPFEGLMPKNGHDAIADIYHAARKDTLKMIDGVIQLTGNDPRVKEKIFNNELLDPNSTFMIDVANKIIKGITVSCWHSNKNESEAMWKIYSENNNGIAIKTSTSSIVSAMKDNDDKRLIHFGLVKYIDYHNAELGPKDYVVDGHTSPLLKRDSFSHENEARLFIMADVDIKKPLETKIEAKFVKVNINDLIELIYISPFAKEPYVSSVYSICQRYGVDRNKIIKSTLLEGADELLSSFQLNKKY